MVEDILACLEAMDIPGGAPESVLGDELGIDSQELICLEVALEERLGIRVDTWELTRRMTVLDLAALLARKAALAKQAVAFDFGLAQDVVIESRSDEVYRALFEFESWPRK